MMSCKFPYILFFISCLKKAGKKPRGRGFTQPLEDEARPGRDVQVAPGECFSLFAR
jgi:hypothetical protein